MNKIYSRELESGWLKHHCEWRDPAQIVSQWKEASAVGSNLLRYVTRGAWWDILAKNKITLLVTREYEHLVMGMQMITGRPVISYMRLPHPSGLVVDRRRSLLYLAATRNPNQVYEFQPVTIVSPSPIAKDKSLKYLPLIPIRTHFFPGSLYIHDLAIIRGILYANAVGQNTVIRLYGDGSYKRVWWPRCIEQKDGPAFDMNYIQLNSIAAKGNLANSYFCASTDKLSRCRPGHRNFLVDKRGVIFSGRTREPLVRGLTRPHSIRWFRAKLWIDNSGYGEFGFANLYKGVFTPITRLSGWTRGLCFYDKIAFVGTSRVIPRFHQYAPGLDVKHSECGIHAIDTRTGKILGSLIWPEGNQIFAIDWMSNAATSGFCFQAARKQATASAKTLFYNFKIRGKNEK